MTLLETLQLPSEWDALSAEPSLELLARLRNLEASPLRDARLAYLLFLNGNFEEAQAILRLTPSYPLSQVARMAIWVEEHRFTRVLTAQKIDLNQIPLALHGEAQARFLLEQSKAQFHLCQYREAWRLARQAEQLARGSKMESLALVCTLHAEECHTSSEEGELNIAEREADLREWVKSAPSQESRVMAYMALVRLLSRQGLYDKAMRFTLEVPRPLNGQHFVELMLVLNNLDDEADWDKFYPRYRGRLHAIKGLLHLDADFVLAGPLPDSSFHPRPLAEWNLAFGWAKITKGDFSGALEHFQKAFIPRCEWDIRFVRGMALIELFLLAPQMVHEYNLETLILETQWLLTQRISPQSLILRLIPRATPYATALVQALPETFQPLVEVASSQLLMVSPKGLSIAGVTHPNSSALVKLLEDDTTQMSGGALRTNRHRLKLFLQQFNQPSIIHTTKVLAVLDHLCVTAEDTQLWQEVRTRYTQQFLLGT